MGRDRFRSGARLALCVRKSQCASVYIQDLTVFDRWPCFQMRSSALRLCERCLLHQIGYISREWCVTECRWYRVQLLIERERAQLGEHKPACLQPDEHQKVACSLLSTPSILHKRQWLLTKTISHNNCFLLTVSGRSIAKRNQTSQSVCPCVQRQVQRCVRALASRINISDLALLIAVKPLAQRTLHSTPLQRGIQTTSSPTQRTPPHWGSFPPHACKPCWRHLLTSPIRDPGELHQIYCPVNLATTSYCLRSRGSHCAVLQAFNGSLGSVCPQQLLPFQPQGPSQR